MSIPGNNSSLRLLSHGTEDFRSYVPSSTITWACGPQSPKDEPSAKRWGSHMKWETSLLT